MPGWWTGFCFPGTLSSIGYCEGKGMVLRLLHLTWKTRTLWVLAGVSPAFCPFLLFSLCCLSIFKCVCDSRGQKLLYGKRKWKKQWNLHTRTQTLAGWKSLGSLCWFGDIRFVMNGMILGDDHRHLRGVAVSGQGNLLCSLIVLLPPTPPTLS